MLAFPCWAYPSKWLARRTVPELYHLDVRCTRRQAYEEHFNAIHSQELQEPETANECVEFNEDANEDSNEDINDSCDELEASCVMPVCTVCNGEEHMVAYSPCGHVECCMTCAKNKDICGVCDVPVANKLKTYIATDGFSDELVCLICMDNELSTVFSPCGHMYCCNECASKLNFCPLCKTWILFTQRIQFLCVDMPKS